MAKSKARTEDACGVDVPRLERVLRKLKDGAFSVERFAKVLGETDFAAEFLAERLVDQGVLEWSFAKLDHLTITDAAYECYIERAPRPARKRTPAVADGCLSRKKGKAAETASILGEVIIDCGWHGKRGPSGGHAAVFLDDDMLPFANAEDHADVIAVTVAPEGKVGRLARAILKACGIVSKRGMESIDARSVLNARKPKVVVIFNGDALWEGLSGRYFTIAQNELQGFSNESACPLVVVGGIGMLKGLYDSKSLAWRFELCGWERLEARQRRLRRSAKGKVAHSASR